MESLSQDWWMINTNIAAGTYLLVACLLWSSYDACVLADILLFLVLLLIAALVGTVFMHLFLRIPYVPSSRKSIETMIALAKLTGNETVYDLGAGDGRVLLKSKKYYPEITAIGIERVPTIWLLGWVRSRGSGIRFERANALRRDICDADVVFLYLFPSLMSELEKKFDRELRPGTKVVANVFPFPNRKPVRHEEVQTWLGKKKVWVYEW